MMPGLCKGSLCGAALGVAKTSLIVVESESSSATSRTTPSTRRTMLPTAISLGCAVTSRLPTSRIRLISACASLVRSAATIRSRSWHVAMAHCREFLICRRCNSETKSSIEALISLVLSDLRKVLSEGACPTVAEGIMPGAGKGETVCPTPWSAFLIPVLVIWLGSLAVFVSQARSVCEVVCPERTVFGPVKRQSGYKCSRLQVSRVGDSLSLVYYWMFISLIFDAGE